MIRRNALVVKAALLLGLYIAGKALYNTPAETLLGFLPESESAPASASLKRSKDGQYLITGKDILCRRGDAPVQGTDVFICSKEEPFEDSPEGHPSNTNRSQDGR